MLTESSLKPRRVLEENSSPGITHLMTIDISHFHEKFPIRNYQLRVFCKCCFKRSVVFESGRFCD